MANSDEQWADCKKKCRLNEDDMALANPIKDWLHEIEAKRAKKSAQKQKRKGQDTQ